MKGKTEVSRIEASRNKRTSKETRYSVLLTVDNSFIDHLLNTHSSPTPLFTPEFQSKGGMMIL